jgi:hypothetical protein
VVIGLRVDDPQCPTRWRRHGAAAPWPELRATRLWCSIFGGFSSHRTGGVRGTHEGGLLPVGGSGVGCVAAKFMLQPSAMVGERSKGRLTTRLSQTGAAWNVEHQRRVDGARGVSHTAW